MPRFISPPLDQLSSLRTPLTPGEQRVLDFFIKRLPEEWEIYIQPHLNGLRPDFVLLNPNVGIAVYEVKDWNLNAMPYKVEYSSQGAPELWATSRDGVDFRVADNPIEKVIQYKDSILNLYCPRLALNTSATNGSCLSVVTAGVILTEATTDEAKNLFLPFQEHLKLLGNKEPYHPIVGIDALKGNQLNVVFPSAQWRTSKYMNPKLADDLRHWLVEPDFASTQREPLELNKRQETLVTSRTRTGYRNVKTAHVFGEDHREKKNRKLGFFMGDARIKAATVHSFKGWESRCLVICINSADSLKDMAAIYVALSRLKRHTQGSYLTVICSAPELEEFGKTWPIFERL